jgi:hypothetical protein
VAPFPGCHPPTARYANPENGGRSEMSFKQRPLLAPAYMIKPTAPQKITPNQSVLPDEERCRLYDDFSVARFNVRRPAPFSSLR